MGKSSAACFLLEQGVPLVDTDTIAHQITAPGTESLVEIERTFGSECLAPDGSLRRDVLARLVFNSASERAKLESILHPRIYAVWHQCIQRWTDSGNRLGAVVIPLLFEKAYHSEFDVVVAVACSAKSQRSRLLARGWSIEHQERRLSSQWSVGKKIEGSDYVVWTEGSMETHRQQWRQILRELGFV